MKFCNKYEEFMRELGQNKLPGIGCNRLKNILESCRKQLHSHTATLHHHQNNADGIPHDADSLHCPVCDGTFFPSLLREMSAVVGFFNEKAQKLLERHLASGCSKCFIWLEDKLQGNHVALIQECKDLVTYASINAIAMRRILKKYDKIHYSKQGQAFKSQAQSMQIEILQSPWLYELMAFHINMKESNKVLSGNGAPALLEGCSPIFNDGKPSLSFQLFDSFNIDIDLTCSICLETLFDPVSLSSGHIFCYMCACKSASVSIVDGFKSVNPNKKCPICRETGVYKCAVHLDELHVLLKRSCPEYWAERRKAEKKERLQLTKEHWESQTRLFMGV